jgi:hypothetical protein
VHEDGEVEFVGSGKAEASKKSKGKGKAKETGKVAESNLPRDMDEGVWDLVTVSSSTGSNFEFLTSFR